MDDDDIHDEARDKRVISRAPLSSPFAAHLQALLHFHPCRLQKSRILVKVLAAVL